MREIISSEIKKIQNYYSEHKDKKLTEDRAFSYVLLLYYFGVDLGDLDDYVTDGTNDGGIDFLWYDEDDNKLILCQSKCTSKLDNNMIIAELDKMSSTFKNFEIGNTSMYNDKLKRVLQNFIDRLPDDCIGNVEYHIYTTAEIDISKVQKKIVNTTHTFSSDSVIIASQNDIERKVLAVQESLQPVIYDKIKLDKAKNVLEYESNDSKGIMVNVSSSSIVALYNKYSTQGLFDLNIRKYIKNTLVDSGIKKTLDKDRSNFWFLNNGIIIACEDYDVDGSVVKLNNFSIVNGGQTTTLISTYKSDDSSEFFIPCKIVAQKKQDDMFEFFTKIAEASNSQKPIYARDLKSNTPEMIRLARWLNDYNIFLEIKRGVKPRKKYSVSIKNDELGQLILSFAFQQPGTSRSGKKAIFENANIYGKIYKVNYGKDICKKHFILDIIYLYDKYNQIETKLKKSDTLTNFQSEILKNGRQIIFALFGMLYRIQNGDLTDKEIKDDTKVLKNVAFNYGGFISNYTGDDLDNKLEKIIVNSLKILADKYQLALKYNETTSVSNFFKTDSKYYDSIVMYFMDCFDISIGEDIRKSMDLFERDYN